MEELRNADFPAGRLDRPGEFVVCFHARWCGFCLEFLPEFAARDGNGSATLALADISDQQDPRWEMFGIDVVPTLIAFRDGVPVARRDGVLGEGLGPGDLDAMGLSAASRRASARA